LSTKILCNTKFPAVFESGCCHGENGEDFIKHLIDNAEEISAGTITIPQGYITKSDRAAVAKKNPMSFVEENKKMLFDILAILFGLTPEDKGFFSKTSGHSTRKTRHYRYQKGVIGYSLCATGAIEDHSKGHLHTHLIINGGLSTYALQRFCTLPELCKKMSDVIDSVVKSQLDNAAQVATLVRRVVVKKRHHWDLDQSVTASIAPKDALLSRPNPLLLFPGTATTASAQEVSQNDTKDIHENLCSVVQAQGR